MTTVAEPTKNHRLATAERTSKPTLCFVYSPTSGPSRRMEGFLAQVLQRGGNHQTFALRRVNSVERPDLVDRLGVTTLPTLLVIEDRRVRARLEGLHGCADIEQLLEPWLNTNAERKAQALASPVQAPQPSLTADPDASFSRVALGLPPELHFERWRAIGCSVVGSADASTWWLADWARYGEGAYGARYRDAIAITGLGGQTLRNYAWVAGRFEASRRRDTLSFAHHAEVAALQPGEQDAWLDRAEEGSWSRNELRARIRREGPNTADCVLEHVRLGVSSDRAERWRSAAEADGLDLPAWLMGVADAAAKS
jgi:hypothetical protein